MRYDARKNAQQNCLFVRRAVRIKIDVILRANEYRLKVLNDISNKTIIWRNRKAGLIETEVDYKPALVEDWNLKQKRVTTAIPACTCRPIVCRLQQRYHTEQHFSSQCCRAAEPALGFARPKAAAVCEALDLSLPSVPFLFLSFPFPSPPIRSRPCKWNDQATAVVCT